MLNDFENEKMTTKEKVLTLLENSEKKSLSGEEMAKELGVTRTSIWKAISKLREDGIKIIGTTNGGYSISGIVDNLSQEKICNYLLQLEKHSKEISFSVYDKNKIQIFKKIDSTNKECKKQLSTVSDMKQLHGTVIIAEKQTEGRGRLGRIFYSPANTGLYMSVVIVPTPEMVDTDIITAVTAVAVSRAIEFLSAELKDNVKIKWVNDLFIKNRKVCGILTEGITNLEAGSIDALIVGIGVNLFQSEEGFPEEINNIAGAVNDEKITRNKLAAAILFEMNKCFNILNVTKTMEEYKSRSYVIGKEVTVISPKEKYVGIVKDITKKGHLILNKKIGDIYCNESIELLSGEVSLRLPIVND